MRVTAAQSAAKAARWGAGSASGQTRAQVPSPTKVAGKQRSLRARFSGKSPHCLSS